MPESIILQACLLALFAGSAIFAGALLADREHIQRGWLEEELHHSILAFGGGALLAAVGLVLVPEGVRNLSLWQSIAAFLAGGAAMMWLDGWLSHA